MFGKKYIISPENLASMVHNWIVLSGEGQEKASEKAGEFVNMIQNPERRIYYAEKFQNYDIAMDVSDSKRLFCFLMPFVFLQRLLFILFVIEQNWKIYVDVYHRIIHHSFELHHY
jgi:hypothetical protein